MHTFYEINMGMMMMRMNGKAKEFGRVSAWMEHCQNEVQQTARAYGDWTIARDALERINEYPGDSEEIRLVMNDMLLLYIVDTIKRNAGQYFLTHVMGRNGNVRVNQKHEELCKSIGDKSVDLTDAFGLTNAMLATPAALDWIDYNSYDNQGEVVEFMKNRQ